MGEHEPRYEEQPHQSGRPLRSSAVDIVNIVMAHAALWVPMLAMMLVVPYFQQMYRQSHLALPRVSEWVIDGGLVVFLAIMLLLLVLDVPVLYFLNRGVFTGILSILWAGFMVVVPLLAMLICGIALWLPMIKLMEGISE
jgi:hypothetical protein